MLPTAAGLVHPIFNGPFGAAPTFNMAGTQGYFADATGATILAEDSTPDTPRPVFLIKTVGPGA
jgi:hypothetical protein